MARISIPACKRRGLWTEAEILHDRAGKSAPAYQYLQAMEAYGRALSIPRELGDAESEAFV